MTTRSDQKHTIAAFACAALTDEKQAHIPLFFYPFLNTTSKSRPFEFFCLTSLGVIGALVKNDSLR